jgi:hypothetical protein
LYSTNPQPDPPPLLPPPAPPTLPGLHSAIACADLEAFRFSLYGQASGGLGDIDATSSVCTLADNDVGGILIDEASMVFTVGEVDIIERPTGNKGSAATCLVDMGSKDTDIIVNENDGANVTGINVDGQTSHHAPASYEVTEHTLSGATVSNTYDLDIGNGGSDLLEDIPMDKVKEFRVLVVLPRTTVEEMLNQVGLPMRPNLGDTQSALAIRLLRYKAGFEPVHKDADLFVSSASSSEACGLSHLHARRVYAAHRSHLNYRNYAPLWFEYSNGTHYQDGAMQMAMDAQAAGHDVSKLASILFVPLYNVSLTDLLDAATLQTSMKRYRFVRNRSKLSNEPVPCKQPVDKSRGLYIFSEAFSHEHCNIFKPK